MQAGQSAQQASSSLSQNMDAFLLLLTTQLKNQDPFDPVDNTQMVAQMAQFSSVAGISEMNSSLKAIQESLASSRVGDAASWIGRSALVASDTVTPLSDGSYAGEIALAEDAANVAVSLVDARGAVVHTATLGAQAAGGVAFAWDGKNASGETVGTGPLRIVVTAANADGFVETSSAAWTQIGAVQSPAGGSSTRLVTMLGLISPEDTLRLG